MTVTQSLPAKDNKYMNGTYYRTTAIIPYVENNIIYMWNGESYCASWGSSNVSSKVTKETDKLIVIEVKGWHKHTIGPVGGYYYFVKNNNGQWERKRANSKAVKDLLEV